MQLTLRIGDPYDGPVEIIYEGALVDEMELAIYAYAESVGGRYEGKVKRWWDNSAREHVEEGLEPLLGLPNGDVLNTWKVWQTVGS